MSTVSKKHRYIITIPLFHVNQIPQIFVGGVERLKCARALDFIEERDQNCSILTTLAKTEHAYSRLEYERKARVHFSIYFSWMFNQNLCSARDNGKMLLPINRYAPAYIYFSDVAVRTNDIEIAISLSCKSKKKTKKKKTQLVSLRHKEKRTRVKSLFFVIPFTIK